MADGFNPGDPGYLDWERGNLRGLGRRKFVGRDTDPVTGQQVDVYELAEDDEWAYKTSESERHLTEHRDYYDRNCQYCNLRLRGDL